MSPVAFLTDWRASSDPPSDLPHAGHATKDEKIQLSIVLARSGDRIASLRSKRCRRDSDPDVAAEGIRSLRALRARLP